MPLIFIAIFLASFLVGSGVSYFTQTQPGFTPTVSVGTPTPILNQTLVCLPEREIIGQYQITPQENAVIIGAVSDLPIPTDNPKQRIPGDGLFQDIAKKDNWTKVLLWLFGGETKNGIPSDPNLDRRQKNWVLIKRDVPIPAWKVAYQSGNIVWNIHQCVWGDPASCATPPNNNDIVFHEMTWIGYLDTTKLSNNYLKNRYQKTNPEDAVGDVWVATGWCGESSQSLVTPSPGYSQKNPIGSQHACADPLIKDLLFVVTKKGEAVTGSTCNNVDNLPCDNPRFGRGAGIPRGPDENLLTKDKSWWRFDVYYNFKSSMPSYDNLPCWMKSCGRNNNEFDPNKRISDPQCQTVSNSKNLIKYLASKTNRQINNLFSFFKKVLLVWAEDNFPQFVSGKVIEYKDISEVQKNMVFYNSYLLSGSSPLPLDSINIGTLKGVDGTIFQVFVSRSKISEIPSGESQSSHISVDSLYLQLNSVIRKYDFVHNESNQVKTIKLETFIPPLIQPTVPPVPAHFAYEWYTPACKPAIYLYPEKETNVSVYVKPQGKLTQTIPNYNNGWENVFATPNGELIYNNTFYPYLYYEAEIKNVIPPKQGWLVKKEELAEFFNTILPYLGLNSKESKDFKDYWLRKLSDKQYYFIGLLDRDTLDQLENVQFSQKPDTFIRIRFYFEGLDKPLLIFPPLLPKTPERKGFVAVDWGGVLAKGACTLENKQIIE